jgi:hypothetical protein
MALPLRLMAAALLELSYEKREIDPLAMFLFDSKRLPLFRKALILTCRGLALVNIVQT